MSQKTAIIIGSGPAGLTAAYELLFKTDIKPIIYEMTDSVGGISKTINYKGNRIDIGGHRFFSKSDKVMQWWLKILPLQGAPSKDDIILKRHISLSKDVNAPDPEQTDRVMLIRRRISRIFVWRKFIDYPLSFNFKIFLSIGIIRLVKILLSYINARLRPIKEEKNLEDFFINRFGKKLYLTLFKDYTQKVWGTSCKKISAEWSIQRVKGLSIAKVIAYALKKNIFLNDPSVSQKGMEISLIERFLYPKFGPGHLWEEVSRIVKDKAGEIYLNHKVIGIEHKDNKILGLKVKNALTNQILTVAGDYFFSTMSVKDLIQCLGKGIPEEVQQIAQGLMYRDFIIVGLLLKRLKIKNDTKIKTINDIIPDNWIYVQEIDVKIGRIQIFNNWSPYLVKDENTVWIGLEYFCNEGDQLWNKSDEDFTKFSIDELVKVGFIEKKDVIDSVIIKMPKVYPAYCGTYEDMHVVRNFTDSFENLFLIGRNGMHRYNNTDHSMLSAMVAVENIINGERSKDNIWSVNTEKEYHEKK